MPVDPSITGEDLIRRSHSYRNYEPEEFVQAWLNAEGNSREEAKVREAMDIMEGGRFEPMLKRTHRMAVALDLDEADDWWEGNEELRRWVNAWAFIQHQRRFPLGLTADEFQSESGSEGIVMRDEIQDPDNSKTAKNAARYTDDPLGEGFDPDQVCGNCAHFIPDQHTEVDGPLCKMVEGIVDAEDVCAAFYSDVGVFADNETARGASFPDSPRNSVRISTFLERGGLSDWNEKNTEDFLESVDKEITDKAGGM